MATLKEQLQKANRLTPEKVNQELFDFIRSIESELTALNRKQYRVFKSLIKPQRGGNGR